MNVLCWLCVRVLVHALFVLCVRLTETRCSSYTAQQTLQGQRPKGLVKGGPAVLDNVFCAADRASCGSAHDIFSREGRRRYFERYLVHVFPSGKQSGNANQVKGTNSRRKRGVSLVIVEWTQCWVELTKVVIAPANSRHQSTPHLSVSWYNTLKRTRGKNP